MHRHLGVTPQWLLPGGGANSTGSTIFPGPLAKAIPRQG